MYIKIEIEFYILQKAIVCEMYANEWNTTICQIANLGDKKTCLCHLFKSVYSIQYNSLKLGLWTLFHE